MTTEAQVRGRREITDEDAKRLIRSADATGEPIEGIVFPPIDFRGERLRGVKFIDCDVGRLGFVGPFLRSVELVDCAFVNCSGPHHVRYKGIRFTRCRWEGGRLSGSVTTTAFRDCQIRGTEIDDVELAKCALEDFVLADVTGQGLTVRDSEVRRVTLAGRLAHVNLIDLTVKDLDLSAFRVIDGGLLGIAGDIRLPDFPDSFVVTAEAIAALRPILEGQVRPEAQQTLERILSDGFALEWFDSRRLDSSPSDTPRLFLEEQRSVLRLLWEHRELAVEV